MGADAELSDPLRWETHEATAIHGAAGQLVAAAVAGHGEIEPARTALGRLAARTVDGVFVTLKRGGTLRGCCGVYGRPGPLFEALVDAAFRTARNDPRMPPVAAVELPYLDLSVSLLGRPRVLDRCGDSRLDAVRVGTHGLRIRAGRKAGLLLPSVATERGWDSRQFLDAVCRKAGLPANAWRSDRATVEVFDATWCSGPVTDPELAVSLGPPAEPRISPRSAAVAGTFYPADDRSREALVDALLAGLPPVERCAPAAVMVPHAGLRFSGRVAADVWRRLRIPRDVLIIGPKHTHHGVDWAVAPHDLWHLSETSRLRGGPDLAQQIAARVPGMQLDSEAHRHEHGIEAQLPLLYRFAPQARVAAIAMHGGTLTELRRAAAGLAEWIRSLKQPPLMVISSDMNHFADDTENRRRDRVALEALATGDAKTLLSVCQAENVTMCGRIPAAITLLTLKALGWRPNYREIAYATSADVSGDRSRVVGYAGVLL